MMLAAASPLRFLDQLQTLFSAIGEGTKLKNINLSYIYLSNVDVYAREAC